MLLLCSLFQDEKGERGGHVEEAREGRAALDRGRGGPHKGTRTREVYDMHNTVVGAEQVAIYGATVAIWAAKMG